MLERRTPESFQEPTRQFLRPARQDRQVPFLTSSSVGSFSGLTYENVRSLFFFSGRAGAGGGAGLLLVVRSPPDGGGTGEGTESEGGTATTSEVIELRQYPILIDLVNFMLAR